MRPRVQRAAGSGQDLRSPARCSLLAVRCPLSLPRAREARRRPCHRGGSARLRRLLLLLPRQLLDALPGEGDLRRGVARGGHPVVELPRRRRTAAGRQPEHDVVLSRQRALPDPSGTRRVQFALHPASGRGVAGDARADALDVGGVALRVLRDRHLGDVLLQPDRRARARAVRAVGGGAGEVAAARPRLRADGAGRRAGDDRRRGAGVPLECARAGEGDSGRGVRGLAAAHRLQRDRARGRARRVSLLGADGARRLLRAGPFSRAPRRPVLRRDGAEALPEPDRRCDRDPRAAAPLALHADRGGDVLHRPSARRASSCSGPSSRSCR